MKEVNLKIPDEMYPHLIDKLRKWEDDVAFFSKDKAKMIEKVIEQLEIVKSE